MWKVARVIGLALKKNVRKRSEAIREHVDFTWYSTQFRIYYSVDNTSNPL